jgi:hypothetical protein
LELAKIKIYLTERKVVFLVIMALVLGAALALADQSGASLKGWIGFSVLSLIAVFSIFGVWRAVQGDRKVLAAATTAFLVRLVLGLFFLVVLPLAGYKGNEVTRAGYLYKDSFVRDQQAWILATSSSAIMDAFTGKYSGDQYGGLLAVSALVYRYLGFGMHRPGLVLLLPATVAALGVLWLWGTARDWFGAPDLDDEPAVRRLPADFIPLTAAWIFALYPESVFLGSAHMREAFVMACTTLALYSLTRIPKAPRTWWIGFGLAFFFLLLFQIPVALGFMVVCAGLVVIEYRPRLSWRYLAFFLAIFLLGFFMVVWNWKNLPSLSNANPLEIVTSWLKNNFGFQSYLIERQSGMIQKLVQGLGKQWLLPIILVYGFAQPVLPATIIDPAVIFWRVFNILRALGWYLLVPFLIYGFVLTLSPRSKPQRPLRIWLNLVTFAWILIAAANAGGDMWDNPRYRVMFLACQAILAAWALWWAVSRRDNWLWRWLAVEAVFVFGFLEWYFSRYVTFLPHLSIWVMTGLTLFMSITIFVGGWLWDRRKRTERVKRI